MRSAADGQLVQGAEDFPGEEYRIPGPEEPSFLCLYNSPLAGISRAAQSQQRRINGLKYPKC